MAEIAESPRRVSNYVRWLPTDVRTRYLAKTEALNYDPYCVREVEFGSDATTWPPVEHVDVINYMTFTSSAYTSDQLKKYKSLDAYKFFQDGWIKKILHNEFEDLHLLLAKVGSPALLSCTSYSRPSIRASASCGSQCKQGLHQRSTPLVTRAWRNRHVRASFDLQAKFSHILVCSHRLGEDT